MIYALIAAGIFFLDMGIKNLIEVFLVTRLEAST